MQKPIAEASAVALHEAAQQHSPKPEVSAIVITAQAFNCCPTPCQTVMWGIFLPGGRLLSE